MAETNHVRSSTTDMKKASRARTFTGCWACRLKKRRCNLEKPICSLCVRHGDHCSYDIRLMWLDENIYKVNKRSQLSNLGTVKSAKLSKEKFKNMMHFENGSLKKIVAPVDELKKDEKFTISIRRFQVYDNAVRSVYVESNRYDQKYVDSRLNNLLENVEDDVLVAQDDACCNVKHGPFNVFSTAGRQTTKIEPIPSPVSSCELRQPEPVYKAKGNWMTPELDAIDQTMSMYEIPELAYLSPVSSTGSMDEVLESKIYNTLWLHCNDNMILSRNEYSSWFIDHMKTSIPVDFLAVIQNIIDDVSLTHLDTWIPMVVDDRYSVDCQSVGVTLLLILNAYYNYPVFTTILENWFLRQSTARYCMYPLINFIVRELDSCQMLYHCYKLLNGSISLQDSYQDELTFELNVMVTEKLVGKWKDRVLQQLVFEQDTSNSCSQLKYWELQLKCQEQFYRDIYVMTDE